MGRGRRGRFGAGVPPASLQTRSQASGRGIFALGCFPPLRLAFPFDSGLGLGLFSDHQVVWSIKPRARTPRGFWGLCSPFLTAPRCPETPRDSRARDAAGELNKSQRKWLQDGPASAANWESWALEGSDPNTPCSGQGSPQKQQMGRGGLRLWFAASPKLQSQAPLSPPRASGSWGPGCTQLLSAMARPSDFILM